MRPPSSPDTKTNREDPEGAPEGAPHGPILHAVLHALFVANLTSDDDRERYAQLGQSVLLDIAPEGKRPETLDAHLATLGADADAWVRVFLSIRAHSRFRATLGDDFREVARVRELAMFCRSRVEAHVFFNYAAPQLGQARAHSLWNGLHVSDRESARCGHCCTTAKYRFLEPTSSVPGEHCTVQLDGARAPIEAPTPILTGVEAGPNIQQRVVAIGLYDPAALDP
jgi:hypothetical protein